MTTAVVVPVYREKPDEFEMISLRQCCSVLSAYPLIFVVPDSLNIDWYREFAHNVRDVRFERFSDSYFQGTDGYSRMMISPDFYSRFLSFDYIFIHQLDVYCFRDELNYWCSLRYDYIGAPWMRAKWHNELCNGIKVIIFRQQSFLVRQITKLRWRLSGLRNSMLNVGNGGCSIRRVKRFHQIALEFSHPPATMYNEDLYWSIFVPLSFKRMNIADWKTALNFAIDSEAERCYNLAGSKLPFAAHAWFRDDGPYEGNLTFWKQFIETDPLLR